MEDIIIRPASQDDWPTILDLIAIYPKQLKQKNLASFRSFFVAEDKEKIVGCCSAAVMILEDPADPTETPKEMEIRSLAVLPEYGGRGIGTKLIQRCEQHRQELGVRQGLTFASEKAKHIFEQQGYKTSTEWKHAMFKED